MTTFKNFLHIETDSLASSKGLDQRMMNICIKSSITELLQKTGRAKPTISTATLLSIMEI